MIICECTVESVFQTSLPLGSLCCVCHPANELTLLLRNSTASPSARRGACRPSSPDYRDFYGTLDETLLCIKKAAQEVWSVLVER